MKLFDWLLTDPTQSDGGVFARLLLDHEPGDTTAGAAPLAGSMGGSLLGESPLINLLRSGFAGMNAANGYSGFGPQFAAGVHGGADAMAQRRQQMIDQINALKLTQALQAKVGVADEEADGKRVASNDEQAQKSSCPQCSAAMRQNAISPDLPANESPADLPRIHTAAEYAALASGTRFVDSLGRIGVKP